MRWPRSPSGPERPASPDQRLAAPGKPGLLLLNLGTPRSPATSDVREYLREFLSDPYVLDMPAPARWLLLNLVILPFRPSRSAHAYRQIWSERGSPLLVHSEELRRKVAERLGDGSPVELAMRYGDPTIAETLARLHAQGVSHISVFPLYPQHSAAATESSVEAVRSAAADSAVALKVVPAFFEDARFIEAVAEAARPTLGVTAALAEAGRSREVVVAVDPFDMGANLFQGVSRLFPQYTSWTTETWVLTVLWLTLGGLALAAWLALDGRPARRIGRAPPAPLDQSDGPSSNPRSASAS